MLSELESVRVRLELEADSLIEKSVNAFRAETQSSEPGRRN